MPKPRTNADAAQYWADSILSAERAPAIDVNSIVIGGDTIYSFGSHYPMGQIIRRDDGTVRRVVVTSSFYPSRGFAHTPGDQYNVAAAARAACAKARIKLERKPLSSHGAERIPALPRADDPEPEQYPRTIVPPLFTPSGNPGPEPVKDPAGCIAGRREEYECVEDGFIFHEHALRLQDQAYAFQRGGPRLPSERTTPGEFTFWERYTVKDEEKRSLRVRRVTNRVNVWGEAHDAYRHFDRHPIPANVDYKQCPHCAAFAKVHEQWHDRMHGPRWGRGHGRGWALYSEMVERYGSEDGWREARRQDVRRVREARKAREEWERRNLIPYDYVARDADRIPIVNDDGFARRIDGEAWRKRLRQNDREARRRQREQHAREVMERRVASARARRQRRKARSIAGKAEIIATNLARLADELSTPTNQLES